MTRPEPFPLRAIEFIGKLFAMTVMLFLWFFLGGPICVYLISRSLMWLCYRFMVTAILRAEKPSMRQFTDDFMLWPREFVGLIRWAFGYESEPVVYKKFEPLELVLETTLLAFFITTVIWANDIKPGYLPNVIGWMWWGWETIVAPTFAKFFSILADLFHRRSP